MVYTVHGILQARILEWVASTFSRGSSLVRDWTQVSRIASRFFTSQATREAQGKWNTDTITVITAQRDLSEGGSGEAVIGGLSPKALRSAE